MAKYSLYKSAKRGIPVALLVLVFLASLVASLFTPGKQDVTSALSGSQFQAGRIIDDSVFFDKNAMTPLQIQQFLNSKVPGCDVHHAHSGNPNDSGAPYTCLKDYSQATTNIAPESGLCQGYSGAASESAAEIIYKVGQSCGINPQVILVMLQKEQGLITDTWPWQIQYDKAMGAFCPDSAPCDPAFKGFFFQVYYGAHRFKVYGANPNSFNYRANRNNYILYNPNTSCGGSTVYIENQATANLYIYTPYQPNPATLAVDLGVAAPCGSYGNKNFWWFFNSWFGTTYGDLFNASLESQSHTSVMPGQGSTVTLKYRNTGRWAWHDDAVNWPGIPPVRLAIANLPRNSIFSYGWYNGYSPNIASSVYESDGTTLAPPENQHVIHPGQIISYTVPITAPWSMKPGTYAESFKPILAGSNIDLGRNATAQSNIEVPPIFRALPAGQSNWPLVVPGDSTELLVRYRNTGQFAWHDSTINWPGQPALYLFTANANGISVFSHSWPNRSLASGVFNKVYESNGSSVSSNQHIVQPGQIVEFKPTVSVPWSIGMGKYAEYFKPVLFGSNVDLGATATTGFEIEIPAWRAVLEQSPANFGLARGNSAWACTKFRNKGTYAWHDSAVNWPGVPAVALATANANNMSIFSYLWDDTASVKRIAMKTFDSVYTADGTPISPNPHVAGPNQIVQFCYIATTPWGATVGHTYTEYMKPVLLGSGATLTHPTQNASVNILVP